MGALLAGAVVPSAWQSVEAAALVQDVAVSAGAEYDSNPAMLVEDEISVSRAILQPEYRMRLIQQQYQIDAAAGLRLERSSNTDVSDDRADPSVSLQVTRAHARGELRGAASYREASTRVTELQDTGQVFRDSTRGEVMVELGLAHDLNARTRLDLSGSYESATFDDDFFIEYQSADVSAMLSYALGETRTVWLQTLFSRYNPDEFRVDTSDGVAGALGMAWQIGPRFEAEASGGVISVSGDGSSTDWIGSLNLRYNGLKTGFDIGYERSTTPSAAGGFENSDNATVTMSYRYSELTTLSLDGVWRRNLRRDLGESYLAQARLERQLGQSWFGALVLAQRGFDGEERATSQVVTLTLEYRPPRRF